MNFNEEDIRSDVGFVCIGQAAGNIGLLFEEKGYNVLYINTSSEDLALLKNAKHERVYRNKDGSVKKVVHVGETVVSKGNKRDQAIEVKQPNNKMDLF